MEKRTTTEKPKVTAVYRGPKILSRMKKLRSNLRKAMEGTELIIRNGKKARFLSANYDEPEFPLLAEIEGKAHSFTIDGYSSMTYESEDDLFMIDGSISLKTRMLDVLDYYRSTEGSEQGRAAFEMYKLLNDIYNERFDQQVSE